MPKRNLDHSCSNWYGKLQLQTFVSMKQFVSRDSSMNQLLLYTLYAHKHLLQEGHEMSHVAAEGCSVAVAALCAADVEVKGQEDACVA
jgi:hypothetical protein